MAENRTVSVVLKARVDAFKADMAAAGKAASDAAQKTETAWDKSNTGMGKAMQKVNQYSSQMTTAGTAMASFGGAVVGALGLSAKAAISWESAFAGVLKTVDGTPRQLAKVEDGLRGLAKTLPASHEEIAAVAEAAGQLGIKTENVVSFTKTMIDMGESTNLSAEDAAKSLSRLSNIMGTSQNDFGKMGASIVGLGNNFATTEREIVEMSMRIAGVGKQAGLSEGDVFGLATALSSVGIEAEAGGTAVSLVMKKIGNEVAGGGDKVAEFARIAGMSSEEFSAAWRDDAGNALDMFVQGLGRARESGENVNGTLSELGITGIRESDALLRLSASGEVLSSALEQGNDEFERGTALAQEAAKRYETAESKISIAGNSLKDTAITIGATFLPAIAESAEAFSDFVEGIGKIPEPVLKIGSVLAGVVGAAALAGGAALILVPKIAETFEAFSTLKAAVSDSNSVLGKFNGSKTGKVLTGIGKAAGFAAGAWTGLQLAAAAYNSTSTKPAVQGIEDVTNALIKATGQSGTATAELDKLFQGKDGAPLVGNVKDLDSAIESVMYKGDPFNKFINESLGGDAINEALGTTSKARDQFYELDEAMANLVNSGQAEMASETFNMVADAFERNGYSAQDAVEFFPELEKAYTGIANEANYALSEQELLAWMMSGEMPPALAAVTEGSDIAAGAVSGVGGAAAEAAGGLAEMLEGLLSLGIIQQSEMEAMSSYEAAIDGINDSVKENGRTLDITTEKGRNNQDALFGIADAGRDAAEAMAENGASQKEVQKHLQRTYDDLVDAGKQFGLSGDEAKEMARKVLGIPDDVSIKTWMSDAAEEQAKDTTEAVNDIPRNVDIDVALRYYEDKSKLSDLQKKYPGARIPAPPTRPNNSVAGPKQKEPRYHGGIDVKPMASGGVLSNIAQMVPPNTWRLVGDRMDVDEAFIPLDGSRRSWKILAETFNRMPGIMPMAKGGVLGGKSAEAKRADEEERKLARERLEAVRKLQADLRKDLRRGSIRDSVTSSLSGGLSTVDELFRLGGDDNLSRGSRSKANSSARKFEANLTKLYAQAERIDERLKKAQDKAQELKGIKDSVVNSLLGGRDLDVGTTSTMVNGQWQTSSNLGQAAKGLRMDVGAMKAFAGKLKKLVELGVPGAIVQEIAQAGVAEGSNMADSFIDATAAERKSYLGAWSDYEKYANQAGQYVTEGFYKGGSQAADGVVKGLEGKQKNVETAIANLAKAMESTFKQVLGIHSPSRVMSELGGFTAEGLVQGMLGGVSDVQSAAAALGSAAVPNMMAFAPTDMSMDVGVNPVVADDEGMAGLAMQDMSNTTLETMALMQSAVSDGFTGMLETVQANQAGMLADTQANQFGMTTTVTDQQAAMLAITRLQQAGMLTETQAKQAAMLLNTQTQQEAMRSTTESKQIATKHVVRDQQEAMRHSMAEKQASMKERSASDFESLRNTTDSKFGAMRRETDSTMSRLHGDYRGRMSNLKDLNKSGFESLHETSDRNMKGIRAGIDGQMRAAKPELGGRMNSLIGVLGSFSESVNKAFGDVGVKLASPRSLKFADGGVLPGYTPGRDVHDFYSPTGGHLGLSGGEAIMRPEFTRAVGGKAGVDRINREARSGQLMRSDHFATGGVIPSFGFANGGTLTDAAKWWQSKGARITEFKAWGQRVGRHSRNSLHYSGRAFDANYGPGGTNSIEQGFFDRMIPVFKPQFPKIRIIWRAPGHYSHAHFDTGRGGDIGNTGGGGGFEMPHPFLDKAGVKPGSDVTAAYAKAAKKLIADIYGKHSKNLPEGFAGDLGKGIMSDVSDGLVKKAKEFGKTAGSGDFSNVANGPIKQMAKQMLEQMGWGDQFGDLNWLLTRESGWRPNAQNPTSTAYGLFQFLNSTWGTVGGSKTSDPKKQLEYGLKYIRQRYGDVRGARAFWNRNHWYENGTQSAMSDWAIVGENGPEAISLKGGEQIKNAADTRKLLAENRTFIPNQKSGFDTSALSNAVSSAIRANGISANDLADALNGVRMTFQADGQQFTGAVTAVVGNGYDESRSRLAKASQKIGAR